MIILGSYRFWFNEKSMYIFLRWKYFQFNSRNERFMIYTDGYVIVHSIELLLIIILNGTKKKKTLVNYVYLEQTKSVLSAARNPILRLCRNGLSWFFWKFVPGKQV